MFASNSSLSESNILFLYVVAFVVSIVIGIGLIATNLVFTKRGNKLGLMAGVFSIKPVVDYLLFALVVDTFRGFFWYEQNLEPINVLAQDVLDFLNLFVYLLPVILLTIFLVYVFWYLLGLKNVFAKSLIGGDLLRWAVVLSLTLFTAFTEKGLEFLLITIPICSLVYSVIALLIVSFENSLSNPIEKIS